MTSYFKWAENKGRKTPRNEFGGETVDIPSILVTETSFPVTEGDQPDGSYMFTLPPASNAQKALERLPTWAGTPWDHAGEPAPVADQDHLPGVEWHGDDRHGWHCPCIECIIDRGEDRL